MKKKNELTTKQRDLVDTIVTTGCTITDASQKVGYAKGEAGRVVASRTLRLPHVQRYMMERVANTIGLGAVSASRKLVELSADAKSEYVQLEASRDLLDRAGIRAPERIQHDVSGEIKINIDLT
jgi:phage terminase small subunit|tara:strand:- start:635 stop:1006 length:372 start_codon:yes stop_codon:yes gene_type:complete